MIYNLGQECNARFDNQQCNSYLITGAKNIIINTLPCWYADEYISAIEKYISPKDVDCIILTDGVPERAGCIDKLLEYNHEITVYASVAGLRNIKEIINKSFCEHMCKNSEIVQIGDRELQFFITPNLPNPDTIMIYSKKDDALFTGFMYMCEADGIGEDLYNRLLPVLPYVENAQRVAKVLSPKNIYASTGDNNIRDFNTILSFYDSLCSSVKSADDVVLIAYASLSGSNKRLAEAAMECLNSSGIKAELVCLNYISPKTAAHKLRTAKALVLGTYTSSRSLPECVWEFLSALDVNSVSSKPYFVFSSYGWSCEGAYISNEILALLKMRKICKPVECVFTPDGADFDNISKAAELMVQMLKKEREAADA